MGYTPAIKLNQCQYGTVVLKNAKKENLEKQCTMRRPIILFAIRATQVLSFP